MNGKKRKCYTNAQVAEALSSIRQGMSIYKASRKYNVPETTIRSKRDELYENEHCGKQPVLKLDEERQIVDWIHYLGKCGFPVTKDQLLLTVSKLVENLQRPNPFKDGVPGKKWFLGFMQRHPTVSKRVSQNLPTSRNQVTEVALRAWFDRVGSYFKENDLLQVFQDPKRIFNCDETGFFLCPKDKQVLVKKGSKRVYNRVANDEKECLTVLVNVSADGNVAPPMVLFPYKRLPTNIKSTVPSWWGLGNTESGWMNMESFYEYVANVFYPWLRQQEITLPVVLFLDGHSSHISLPLTTFCKEKGIVLVALLPNSTHVLQPLDVAVFRPVKGTWRDIVREFRVKQNYAKLKRTDFSREVQKCFDRSLKPETIMSGFKCCGLYPFDEQNLDYGKLLSKVKKHQDKLSETNQNTLLDSQQMSNIDSEEMFKKQFESRLSQDTLKSFKEAGNQWTCDPTYEKLFLFWKSLTSSEKKFENQADSALEIGETTFTNNVDVENVYDSVLSFDIKSNDILTQLNDKEANNIGSTILESTQVSQSSINAILTIEESTFKANSLLPTSLVDSPLMMEIIDPRLVSEVTPPQKMRLLTEENGSQILRSSTPELSKCSSTAPSLSEIETADHEVNCSSSLNLHPLLQKSLIMPSTSTSKTPAPIVIDTVTPTPFKGIPTPFKNAFFFPKTENTPKTKKVTKKVTPTVATAAEFIEHQRRLDKEKEEKEKLKQLRKCAALKKKYQKENNKKIKQAQTEKKKEESKKKRVMKLKNVNMETEMQHVNTTDNNISDSDDDLIFNIPARIKQKKRRCFFDSDDSV